MCSTVMCTALIGRYDDFGAFARKHALYRAKRVCYIVLVDEKRANGDYAYWLPVLVRPLFLDHPARSAHIPKSVPFQLFPGAGWVVYIDAHRKDKAPHTGAYLSGSTECAGATSCRRVRARFSTC